MGHGRLGQTRQQTTDWGQSRAERAGVTDGLGLPASLLISSEEEPETHRLRGLQSRRAGGAGRQIDGLMQR